jgi:hypothetical protein
MYKIVHILPIFRKLSDKNLPTSNCNFVVVENFANLCHAYCLTSVETGLYLESIDSGTGASCAANGVRAPHIG